MRTFVTKMAAPGEDTMMKHVRYVLCVISSLSAVLLQGCAGSGTYSARPIIATVVDAETGVPLEGVNIVVRWALEEKTTGTRVGDLDLMEAVTDKNGTFHISGWQGKAPPEGTAPWTDKVSVRYETRLSSGSPEIILFKSGYEPTAVGNYDYLSPALRDEHHTWQRFSEWDGKVIKLKKYKGDPASYGFGITTNIGSGIKCHWKKIPRFYAALMAERDRLNKLGVGSVLPSLDGLEHSFMNSGCGSAAEFFKQYLQ